jgi:hypothetical protein
MSAVDSDFIVKCVITFLKEEGVEEKIGERKRIKEENNHQEHILKD